jgi:hypothetical protein
MGKPAGSPPDTEVGRKSAICRDSLHFQAGKDYMLNFLQIMKLQHSTA